MANTKEYKIVINGLTESINAVDSLNKQLDKLEQRMKSINTSKASAGGGSSASRGSNNALTEEEAIQKEINKLKQQGAQLDAKIAAAQNEIYKKVDATKELYKATIADQKALAAQERLTANAYSDTMVGMKQQLADLKAVIQTTDLGDSDKIKKMTEQANELTNKLKEMEEAYGQFGRNVGNYKSAFDGFEKVTVTINGVVMEFDNLKQATKAVRDEMGKLDINGKKDTETYKQLENEASRLAKAQLRLNSAMNDAKASSQAMDDMLDTMESFTALGQVGQGFSTLFGLDNSALEQQIAKLVALQNVLSGIEKIRQQMNTGEGLGKWFNTEKTDKFVAKLTGARIEMGKLVASTKSGTTALRGLSTAMTMVGGTLKAMGIMVVVEAAANLVKKFYDWVTGGNAAAETTEMLNKTLEAWNKNIERAQNNLKRGFFEGYITSTEYATKSTKILTEQIQILLEKIGDLKKTDFTLDYGGKSEEDGFRNALDRMEQLAEALDIANEKAEKSWNPLAKWFEKIGVGLTGVGREYRKLGEELTGTLLSDMQNAVGKVNEELEKTGKVSEETTRRILQLGNRLHDPRMVGILEQVDKFSDRGSYYVTKINAIRDAFDGLIKKVSTAELDPDKMMQLEIDAMKDGLKKRLAQIELNQKKELAEVGNNEAAKEAVRKKYRRQEIEAEKAYGKEYKAALADLTSIRIEIMKEGWEKEKAQLEHERDERIRAVKESEILVGERTAAIKELYRKKIAKAEKEWRQQQLDNYREFLTEIEMMNRETYAMEVSNSLQNVDNRTFAKNDNADKSVNENTYKDINKMKEYYNELLKIELDAAKEEEAIRQEALRNELDDAKKDEEIRHQRLVNANNGEYIKQLQEGLITKQQYDDLIQKEEAAHEAAMNALEKRYAAESLATTQDGLSKMYNAYNSYYQRVESLIRRKQDKIQNDLDDAVKKATRQSNKNFGFFNAKELGKQYDEAIKKQKELIEKIKGDLQKLEDDNKAGKVIGEAYEKEKENLEASLRAGIQTLENYKEESTKIVDKVVANINQYFQILGQSIQQIMSSVWDYQDYMLDKEQDELDKWNEKLDKALEKQQKIVEEHKNNVNSIEDELASARGDRRQHLIDQLNAQIAAQREAQKEEKRIQKEKEAAEKKQEALDKKRKEQEYKRNVTQAFISWHLAIANGLATQPFMPVGIAMGALATALGAVQYALVKSQKPYAKGGQLDGPSHREGGIKVPGIGGGIELEGQEYVIRKKSTAKNLDILDYINRSEKKLSLDDFIDFYGGKVKKNVKSMSPGRKFADGGTLPTLTNSYSFDDRLLSAFEDYSNRQVVVSVVDINNRQAAVKNVQVLAGVGND